MQRTLTLDERSFVAAEPSEESFCLVCNATLSVASSTNVFYTSLARNGESLANFVLRVLRPVAGDLPTSYICSRCNELFRMLEQAQRTVSNIRCEILKVYRSRESEKLPEHKANLSVGQILADDLFEESERKIAPHGERFDDIDEFGGLRASEGNESGARNESFDNSPNDFCNLNIEIDNGERKFEIHRDNVYESKIDRPKPLDVEHGEDVARSETYGDSPNDFRNLNIGIDDDDEKKIVRHLEVGQSGVYENKIDCLETLDVQLDGNLARTDTFGDSQNHFCNLNIGIGDCDKQSLESIRLEREKKKPVGRIAENVVYEAKVDCPKVEESTQERPKEREDERKLENCSRDAQRKVVVNFSNDLFDSSIDRAERPPKNEKKDEYTMRCGDEEIPDFTGEDCIVSVDSESNEDSESRGRRPPPPKSGRISKYSLKPLKYACSSCGKKWRTSAELKTHVKSHSNLRPYMCEKCGQAYKHKNALEIHVGMHNGISPYRCNVCNKCFTQKGALMRHLPLHTGEMPYQCELCGKRFVHHTSYNMHALSHTGKKSYQCHVCDLSLLSTSHLKRHMRVHTGEKPYSCELCGKSFAERYNLFAHRKIHDPAEIMAKAAKKITYKCEQCDEIFDKKQKLDEHTKERHGDGDGDGGGATNGNKWIGHTATQSWQHYNYSKLQSVVAGMKNPQNDNALAEISHESIALLVSHANYSKSLAVMIQPPNSTTNAEIDQTQI